MPGLAQRGRGGIAPPHSQPANRRQSVVSTTLQPLYPRKGPVSTVRYIKFEVFNTNIGFVAAQQIFSCIVLLV